MGKVVGIDLGTTCSLISIKEGNQVRVLVNAEGSRLTPSIVAFTDDGQRIVGRAAKSQAAINPTRTLSSVKRLIGRRRNEVLEEEKSLSYKVVGDADEMVKIEVDGKTYRPEEISAMVLQDLKKSAERVLGEPITECCITVPARFGDAQRNATKLAGEIAGLKVLRILSEPTSAALAYGLDKGTNEKILVADIGGGTDDVSVIETGDNFFQVLATSGDLFLGGDCFDQQLVEFVAQEFKKENAVDILADPMAKQRLLEACEKAKCDLSTMLQTTISLPYITAAGGVPKHLNQVVTRAKFEQLCAPLFERFKAPIVQVLSDAKLLPGQISQVVLVGGSSRMPKIVSICKEIFGKDPHQGINPDEAIAIGAAICGSVLSGETTDLVLIDVTPLSLGLETLGGVTTILIPRNSSIPTSKTEPFTTAIDNQPAVDIHVLQGERRMATGNRTLGRFQLSGIPLQPRGKPSVEVTFDLDANGILNVSAKDGHTGKEVKIEVKASSGLEKTDIDRMVKDAAAYEAEDKTRADLVESRNKADNLVYGTETFMRENTKLISAGAHASVKAAVDALKAVLDAQSSKDVIESGMDALEVANKKMYDECFKGAAKPGPAPAANPNVGVPNGDAIDVQFEIK